MLYWYGSQTSERIEGAAWEGVQRATEFFHRQLMFALNTPAVKTSRTRTRNTAGGPKGSTYTVYVPSAPGELPRKRTGFLQSSVQREYDESTLTARVGVTINAIYGLFLELGTKKMAARPWLLATLNKYLDQIRAQLVLGMPEDRG